MAFNLFRFINAQNDDYDKALSEIKNGRKTTHWMWYIFPQIKGLAVTETAQYYEIKSLGEARAYLDNEVLHNRLIEMSNELLKLDTCDPIEIFGDVDALKLRSSMTLFSYISNEEIFNKVIDKYYNGVKDELTITICNAMEEQYDEQSRMY